MYNTMRASDIMANVNNCSPFSSRLISSHFCSIPNVFHQFLTWITLGYVDLHFTFWQQKPILLKEELQEKSSHCAYMPNRVTLTIIAYYLC